MKQAAITIITALVLVLIVIPAHAKNKTVQGTVIKVEQHQQTQK